MAFSRRWCRLAAEVRIRIELGFQGGQVVVGFVDPASADQLERALHEDGPYHVVVPQVAYFKRFSRASRVGFGSG